MNDASPIESVTLDDTDLRVLALLQEDASRSNQDLAAAAHTSPATCLRRVKRLVDLGVIERRIAILSPQRLGAGLTAIVEVTLDRQGAEHVAAFEARAVADAAVQQCYRVTPGPDLVLIVQTADMAEYSALVQRLFTQDANVRTRQVRTGADPAEAPAALSAWGDTRDQRFSSTKPFR